MYSDFCFFNDTATTEIYTLSLHDALPISRGVDALPRELGAGRRRRPRAVADPGRGALQRLRRARRARHPRRPPVRAAREDRKSTRLNSSHANISYAVFCLKKKKIPYFYLD